MRSDLSLLPLSPAKPQNKAETQEAPPSPPGQEPAPEARCVSTGGRPPARISWSLDGKVRKSRVPGPCPATRCFSLLTSTPSSQVDGQAATCTEEHGCLEEPGQLPVHLTVPRVCAHV